MQAQINPHFIFNTINTIAAFIRTDPTEARRLLRQFGSFYRRTLEEAEDLVTLDRELEFVDTYVQLEKARFGDRLEFVQDVEAGAHSCALPAFMIQPLVENAVGHGMRPEGDTLHVTVSARVVDGALTVIVADDGVGISAERLPDVFEPGFGTGLGIALRNIRDRLTGYFGRDSQLVIHSTQGVGTTAEMVIPCTDSECRSDAETV